jgi:hypothetical protein
LQDCCVCKEEVSVWIVHFGIWHGSMAETRAAASEDARIISEAIPL